MEEGIKKAGKRYPVRFDDFPEVIMQSQVKVRHAEIITKNEAR